MSTNFRSTWNLRIMTLLPTCHLPRPEETHPTLHRIRSIKTSGLQHISPGTCKLSGSIAACDLRFLTVIAGDDSEFNDAKICRVSVSKANGTAAHHPCAVCNTTWNLRAGDNTARGRSVLAPGLCRTHVNAAVSLRSRRRCEDQLFSMSTASLVPTSSRRLRRESLGRQLSRSGATVSDGQAVARFF